MEPDDKPPASPGVPGRLGKSWFPPAAVVGAFAALTAGAIRVRPTPAVAAGGPLASHPPASGQPARILPRTYTRAALLGGATSARPFRRSLSGIAVAASGRLYGLGDDEVRLFAADGGFVESWKVVAGAGCLAVGPDGIVYVGAADRVEMYGPGGRPAGGFAAGAPGHPASVTAIKVFKTDILVADANARLIRRYGADLGQRGVIGDRNKTGSFMLPNGILDLDVDAAGVVRATDTGRHQVTAWTLDGAPVGKFGKFGMEDPADFVGCCNPVNLAIAPDGKIVTAEKMVARVKVYEPDGTLLALIGSEHFDPKCTQIHVAVDAKGRIVTADPVRRHIQVFAPAGTTGRPGGPEPAPDEAGRR